MDFMNVKLITIISFAFHGAIIYNHQFLNVSILFKNKVKG